MAYNLEEQEQLENLKAFWKQYGNFILTVVAVAALAVAGWRGWGWYQARDAAQAAVYYEQLREAASVKDVARVRANAGTLFDQYGRTAYGQMAALVAARAYAEAGDVKAAKAALRVGGVQRPGRRISSRSRGFAWRRCCSTKRPTTRRTRCWRSRPPVTSPGSTPTCVATCWSHRTSLRRRVPRTGRRSRRSLPTVRCAGWSS